ncbi:carbohydrate ABC transporter permease [Promicromonospora sp. Marseille-Q5078]
MTDTQLRPAQADAGRGSERPQASVRTADGSSRLRRFGRHLALAALGIVMIYPLLWMIASSLRTDDDIFTSIGLWVPHPDWGNYAEGWNGLESPFGNYLVNSAIIAVLCILGNLVAATMAAYAFARLRFRFKRTMFAVMLLTIMLPIHVVIVPQYILFSNLGWLNTFVPLVLPKFLATDAFFVFLMVQFMRGIPRELDEAARLDGCGYLRTFGQIILPLTVPALATTAIFTFIWTWNDFFSQLIYLTEPVTYSVPVALRSFMDATSGTSWGPLFAMSVVTLVPVFLAFLLGQRFLVRGIATTGGK